MEKAGTSLRAIDGFPGELTDLLRERLSVTTAEEFVELASKPAQAASLQQLLGIDTAALSRLQNLAAATISPQESALTEAAKKLDYRFRTGHDIPRSDGNRPSER